VSGITESSAIGSGSFIFKIRRKSDLVEVDELHVTIFAAGNA
jgi:hypothetical protein